MNFRKRNKVCENFPVKNRRELLDVIEFHASIRIFLQLGVSIHWIVFSHFVSFNFQLSYRLFFVGCFSKMNHAIIILGGGPIRQFSDDSLPTVRDVLRYYMQFWKLKGSESKREKIVARDLIDFYKHRNINIMSEPGIKYKVKRLVEQLKSIIKSRTRPKTVSRAHFETEFMNRLNTSFQIAVAEPRNITSGVIISYNQPGTSMESENSDKIRISIQFSSEYR